MSEAQTPVTRGGFLSSNILLISRDNEFPFRSTDPYAVKQEVEALTKVAWLSNLPFGVTWPRPNRQLHVPEHYAG